MPATVKLLGPDLGNPLNVEVEATDTIQRLKECALGKWPEGASRLLDRDGVHSILLHLRAQKKSPLPARSGSLAAVL